MVSKQKRRSLDWAGIGQYVSFGTMPVNRVFEGEMDGYPYNQSYLTNMVE